MITDLLFYEPSGGLGEFYTTYLGGINLLQQHTGWSRTWTQIIPGNFGGGDFTDLLFYQASTGTGVFYRTNGLGGMSRMEVNTDWHTGWTQIVPGNFGGSGFTDLLFYDAAAGIGDFYTCVGPGQIHLLRRQTGWHTGWTHIIPGNFGGSGFTDLLFYDAAAGKSQFYTTEKGSIKLLSEHPGWRKGLTQIVPGLFAPLQAVRLHLKVLFTPPTPIETQLSEMREVFLTAGIRVVVLSTEFLDLPELLDVDFGECKSGGFFGDNIREDLAELFRHRRDVGANEIAIYFVHSIKGHGGCAKYPGDKAGATIASRILHYTLGHEVGHVLGLFHTDNQNRLMFPGKIINAPPNLNDAEKSKMSQSQYTIDL